MSKIYVRSYGWMAVLIIHLYEESPRRIEHEPPTVFVFFPILLGTADLIFADRWIDGDRTPTALQVTSAPAGPPYTQWDADRFCEFKWWSHHGLPPEGGIYFWSRKTPRGWWWFSHTFTHSYTCCFLLFLFYFLTDLRLDSISFLESGTVSSLTYFSYLSLPALVVLVGSTMHA